MAQAAGRERVREAWVVGRGVAVQGNCWEEGTQERGDWGQSWDDSLGTAEYH